MSEIRTFTQEEIDEAVRQEREGCAFAVETHSGFGDPSTIEVCAANVRARGDSSDECIHLDKGRYAELIASLQECEEYFDNRADADHDETGFVPNKEMRLLSIVRAALEKAGA